MSRCVIDECVCVISFSVSLSWSDLLKFCLALLFPLSFILFMLLRDEPFHVKMRHLEAPQL